MIDFNKHIILDRINSWPDEVLELIKTNESSLKGFFVEEHRKLESRGIPVEYHKHQNIYQDKWANTTDTIERILKDYSIVGIHATKLLENEINDVLKNGLKPLSKEFAIQRVQRIFENGLISEQLRDEIISNNNLEEANRKGKIFVFHCLSTLKDESGLSRLFGYWGGEAIYINFENSKELRKIGIPCIVFTSIKIRELHFYPELSKRMIAHYFDDNLYPRDTDSIFEKKLDVLRIVKRREKIFEDLTQIQNWDNQLN